MRTLLRPKFTSPWTSTSSDISKELERRSGIGFHNPIASEKTIAVMTVNFITIEISSTM